MTMTADAQRPSETQPDQDLSYGTRLEATLPTDDRPATVPRRGDESYEPVEPEVGRASPETRQREAGKEDKGQDDGRPGATRGADEPPPPPPPPKWVFALVALVLVGLLGWGAYGHWRRSGSAEDTQNTTISMVPEVRTTEAKRQDQPVSLTLPGQTAAFFTANILPRATGYVTARNVDIGSRVKKGDLLVHIAAPDVDQQLAQAVAQLGQVQAAETQAQAQVAQAEANLNLAKVTLARTNSLTQQGYETLQNRDNQQANLQSQQANVDTTQAGVKVAAANSKAQQATVDRLKALAAFEDVTAPFDGVVTMRNVDLGDLVNADSASSNAMFSVARDDLIRVTVQVPQNSAIGVRDGLEAKIEVPQVPGQGFTGKVTRSSVALISSARTLTTEVDIPNPDGKLRPGLYVYVTLAIPRDHPGVVVPAEALIFNQQGLRVAAVDGDTVKMHEVKISRDFGTTVELSEGLSGGEQVVLSPPATLQDGVKVKAEPADNKKSPSDNNGQNGNGSHRPGASNKNGGQNDENVAKKRKDSDQG